MSQLINVENFNPRNVAEETFLTADALAGQKVINIENRQGFASDSFIVLGLKGGENTRIHQIDLVNDLVITLISDLETKHFQGESIYRIRADRAKVYRAANVDGTMPAYASFTTEVTELVLAGDRLTTEYTDPTGGADYWYLTTYYNSITEEETAKEDSTPVRGGNYGLYVTVDEVREEAGLQSNRYITDQFIQSKLYSAQSEVNTSLAIAGYTLPLTTVPSIIKNATLLIAAGYVLLREYGTENSGTNKEGNQKIKAGRELLAKLESGGQTLVDDTGTSVARSNKINGYPDGTNTDHGPMFRVTSKF